MAYLNFVENISDAIEEKLSKISSRYNFDLGDEFEIGLCELLSDVLPEKYGICRGFIVTEDNSFAGDDIIIYAKDRFPTVRLLGENKFMRKHEVPIESVYGYIEAKHTLYLTEKESGQSMFKALEQVSKVKALSRESRSIFSIDPYTVVDNFEAENRNNWPKINNPFYTAIFSRFAKESTTSKTTVVNASDLFHKISSPIDCKYPDLIVMGQNDLLFPGISHTDRIVYESPFFVGGTSSLIHKKTKTSALAIGIIMLLYALDTIKLGKMPYQKIIQSQLR